MAKTFKTNQSLINDGFNQISGETLSLSGNTLIGSSATLKYSSDQSSTYVARSVVDAEYVTGSTSDIRNIGSVGQVIYRGTSGITGATGFTYDSATSGVTVPNLCISQTPATQAGDYFILTWYSGATSNVNKIPALSVTGLQCAINGLGVISDCACLGGTLISNTIIDGCDCSLGFCNLFGTCFINTGNNIVLDSRCNSGGIYLKSQSGVISSPVSNYSNSVGIAMDYPSCIFKIYDNRIGAYQKGIEYDGNYSTSYTPRSLVDKAYVDTIASGLYPKQAVQAATTPASGDTTLSGCTGTIDGVSISRIIDSGNRILVKDKTNAALNGVYSASTSVWGRTSDFDFTPVSEVVQGSYFFIMSGTNKSSTWVLTTPDIIISGDTLTFTEFNRVTDLIGGTGITITTHTIGEHTISVDGQSLVGNSLSWNTTTYQFDVNISGGTLSTALNNKLNVSTFSDYTGTTETQLQGIENDIVYLSGVTDTKLNIVIFSGYTGTTRNELNLTITGATNFGAGTTVYSGSTGRNLQFNTIVGSGGTAVQKVGDEIIVCSVSVSGGQEYSGETPSAVNLCGISIGYELTGKTVSCIIQDLLVPELFQTSVGTPSTSVGATFSNIREIGYSASQTITPNYSAGAIIPLYCTDNGTTRGGAANNYEYTGPDVVTGFNGCTSCVINPYVVTSGSQSWCVCTRYDDGACIKGSKGTVNPSYPTICAQDSCTSYGTVSINGILPWYWGTNATDTITSAVITGGTKTVGLISTSTSIIFNATTEYLWFAAPAGCAAKTKWWVCAANAGDIGGTGQLWAASCNVAVTSGQGCWSGCNFDVYVTCGITTTAAGISMCLYY